MEKLDVNLSSYSTIIRCFTLMRKQIESFRQRYGFHLRLWHLAGCGIQRCDFSLENAKFFHQSIETSMYHSNQANPFTFYFHPVNFNTIYQTVLIDSIKMTKAINQSINQSFKSFWIDEYFSSCELRTWDIFSYAVVVQKSQPFLGLNFFQFQFRFRFQFWFWFWFWFYGFVRVLAVKDSLATVRCQIKPCGMWLTGNLLDCLQS